MQKGPTVSALHKHADSCHDSGRAQTAPKCAIYEVTRLRKRRRLALLQLRAAGNLKPLLLFPGFSVLRLKTNTFTRAWTIRSEPCSPLHPRRPIVPHCAIEGHRSIATQRSRQQPRSLLLQGFESSSAKKTLTTVTTLTSIR